MQSARGRAAAHSPWIAEEGKRAQPEEEEEGSKAGRGEKKKEKKKLNLGERVRQAVHTRATDTDAAAGLPIDRLAPLVINAPTVTDVSGPLGGAS